MDMKRLIPFVIILGWAGPVNVVDQQQAEAFGKFFDDEHLSGGWKVAAIEAKKDHIEVTCSSPRGDVKTGFYHLSAKGDFAAKTGKFGLRMISGKDDGTLVNQLADIVKKKESGFKWTTVKTNVGNKEAQDLIKRLIKARELYAFGKKQEALKIVEDMGKKATTPGTMAQVARYYMDFGDREKGKAVFAKAFGMVEKRMKENPDNPYVIAEAVSVYVIAGKFKEAEDLYWKLMAKHKEPFDGKVCLASRMINAKVGSKEVDTEVLNFYHKVLKRFPNCKRVYMNAMFVAGRLKDFKEVDRLAKTALKRWPKDQDVLFTWGNVYHVSGKFKKAEDIFVRLAAINPQYPTLLSLLGGSLVNLGKSDERLEYLKRQVKLHPDNLGWYYGLGAVYFYRKNYEKARSYLERTAKLAPKEARPKIYLALSLYWLGHKKEARKILDDINDLAYEDPDVFFCQAIVWSDVDKKRSLQAMQKFINILDNEPNRVQWGNKRARAHKILDELKEGKVNAILMEGQPEDEEEKIGTLPWMIGIGILLVLGVWGYLLFRPREEREDS